MAATALPTLPGCGRAASARIEVYSPRDGRLHGSLDGSVYACDQHAIEAVSALYAAGFTPHRMSGGDGSVKRCGDGFDFLSGYPLTAPNPPEGDEWHPDWCEVPHRHGDGLGHASPPLEVLTGAGLTVVRLEQQRAEVPASLTISHWHTRVDPADEPSPPAEPDELLYMPVPAAAELAAHITALIALDLGGAR